MLRKISVQIFYNLVHIILTKITWYIQNKSQNYKDRCLSHCWNIHTSFNRGRLQQCNASSPLEAWFPAPAHGSYCFALADSFSLDALPVWHSELPASQLETPSRTSAGEARRSSPLGLSWQDQT